MKITKKIQPYVIALGIGASALTGCATTQVPNSYTHQTKQETLYEKTKKAMDVLKVKNPTQIKHYPNGYITLKSEDGNLRTLADIYAGNVEVEKIENGYTANGSYSQFQNPEAMQKILKIADRNSDKIVTDGEVRDLTTILYKIKSK